MASLLKEEQSLQTKLNTKDLPVDSMEKTTESSQLKEKVNELSQDDEKCIEMLIRDLKSKTAFIDKDESGNIQIEYNRPIQPPQDDRIRKLEKKRAHVDVSQSMLIASPPTKSKQLDCIEALIENINVIKKIKCPIGVSLDASKDDVFIRSGSYRDGKEFEKTREVLGSGSVAGEVIVVKDKTTKREHALKTVMIANFREEELRMWIDLNDEDFVPSLFIVRMENNKLHFHMEKLSHAVTLQSVIDDHMNNFSDQVKPVSLCILHGLLSAVSKMHDQKWTHRDLHSGNVLLKANKKPVSVDIKIIDFGLGQFKYHPDGNRGIQNDILSCFRIFIALYLGQEFDSLFDVQMNGMKKLEELSNYYGLREEDRKEILQLCGIFLEVVEFRNKNFGDTKKLLKHVEGLIEKNCIDKQEILQQVAIKLFPEVVLDHVDYNEESSMESNNSACSQEFIDGILSELAVGM